MFIFYPVQKELRDNIAAAPRHRRHSAKPLKTNTLEGLTVHEGCAEGNEEEIDCHSRIREEHGHCHVARPRASESTIVVKWCYDKGIRSWRNLNTDSFRQGQGGLSLLTVSCLCGGYATQSVMAGVDRIITVGNRWRSEKWAWHSVRS